jgi:guanylate kinase
MYGTPIGPVRDMLDNGKTVFLIIEVEGGGNVKKAFPDATKIFIIPPSMSELERRLRGRGTDSEEAILKRLEIAKSEILRAEEYDFIVENDELENAVEDVITIVNSQLLKTDKMKNKIKEVIENA